MNEILDFIRRRFSTDCRWLDGNCYYFAVILKDRFRSGKIFYDETRDRFLFLYDGKYYDWTGEVIPEGDLVEWKRFMDYDSKQRDRIIEGSIW